jgi:Mn-dependent DtxR family transcriptional regulator
MHRAVAHELAEYFLAVVSFDLDEVEDAAEQIAEELMSVSGRVA